MTIRRVKNGEEKRKRFESRIICKSSPKVKKKKKNERKLIENLRVPQRFSKTHDYATRKKGEGEREKKRKKKLRKR